MSAVFDGWGYTHMYRTDLTPEAKMEEVDFYALPEGQDPAYAENFGDMSVHEVATDPDEELVYVSHYALGMRVLSYDDDGLDEVGAFVEAGGSNYWGVEVHNTPTARSTSWDPTATAVCGSSPTAPETSTQRPRRERAAARARGR